MPASVIKKFAPTYAKREKISVQEAVEKLEEYWEKAKELANEKFEEGTEQYWSYVMGIWKRMSKYSEFTAESHVNSQGQLTLDVTIRL